MRMLASILILLVASTVWGLPTPQDGEQTPNPVWGEWSAWSPCTRSCGSGVSSQQRSCTRNCEPDIGLEKRYQSCCIQDCPADSPDFLQQQCLDHPQLPTDSNWTLAVDEDNDGCSLYCQDGHSDSPQTRKLSISAEPGTPCRTGLGEGGVCLGGNQCAVIGCDGVLGSNRFEDGCLQCLSEDEGSRSTTCAVHKGTSSPTISSRDSGTIAIFNIPQGATSLRISHPLDQLEGRLALKLPSNEYAFRVGNNNTKFEVSGVEFLYRILRSGDGFEEHITSRGPLTIQRLQVELHGVAMGTTPKASFEFYQLASNSSAVVRNHTHRPISETNDDPVYMWKHMAISECSATCGHGLRTLEPKCVDAAYPDRPLQDEVCEYLLQVPKPIPFIQPCQLRTCPPFWMSGPWSPCSHACAGGTQTRHVECLQAEQVNGRLVLTNSSSCDQSSRPAQLQLCAQGPCRFAWVSGEWSECSEDIYEGVQYRSLQCLDRILGDDNVDHSNCSAGNRPQTARTCRLANCEGGRCYKWVPKRWRRCNESCGYGYQPRNVFCETVTGVRTNVNESFCVGLERPAPLRECYDTRDLTCTPLWQAGDYGECEGDCCRRQHKQRSVQCVVYKAAQRLVFPDEACDQTAKPENRSECQRDDCPQWDTPGPWGECPETPCGEGPSIQTREVNCVRGDEFLERTQCCSERLPMESQLCPVVTCPPTPPPPCAEQDALSSEFCRELATEQFCELFGNRCARTCFCDDAMDT